MADVPIFEVPGRGAQISLMAIFKQIWMLSDKKSFISGLFLRDFISSEYALNCFAHVLPKAMNKYPYFKYYAKNIVLLTPGEHSLWDHGTEEARISYAIDMKEKTKGRVIVDWDKLKAFEQELLAEYKKFFPTKRGLIINYKYSPDEQVMIVGRLNRAFFTERMKERKPTR